MHIDFSEVDCLRPDDNGRVQTSSCWHIMSMRSHVKHSIFDDATRFKLVIHVHDVWIPVLQCIIVFNASYTKSIITHLQLYLSPRKMIAMFSASYQHDNIKMSADLRTCLTMASYVGRCTITCQVDEITSPTMQTVGIPSTCFYPKSNTNSNTIEAMILNRTILTSTIHQSLLNSAKMDPSHQTIHPSSQLFCLYLPNKHHSVYHQVNHHRNEMSSFACSVLFGPCS